MISTAYEVVHPDGSVTSYTATMDEKPGYKALKLVIEPHLQGQGLEHVTVFWNGKYADMFVGDFSAVSDWPVNEKATEIYHNNIKTHDPELYASAKHAQIYGPVVLFSRRVWF